MASGTVGLAPPYLLLVILVFGLLWLCPWSERWRRPDIQEAAAKRPRPLKPKTGGRLSVMPVAARDRYG